MKINSYQFVSLVLFVCIIGYCFKEILFDKSLTHQFKGNVVVSSVYNESGNLEGSISGKLIDVEILNQMLPKVILKGGSSILGKYILMEDNTFHIEREISSQFTKVSRKRGQVLTIFTGTGNRIAEYEGSNIQILFQNDETTLFKIDGRKIATLNMHYTLVKK